MAAFFERDHTRAARIRIGDDSIDTSTAGLCDDIRGDIRENSEKPEALFTLLSIVQRMGRLGDHAANIAKNAIYLVLGEIVRHRMGEFRQQLTPDKKSVLMVCLHNSARSQGK